MALKAIATKVEFDALSADEKRHYAAQQDGTYRIDVVEVNGFKLNDSTGLMNALEGERKKSSELAAKAHLFEGLDPEKARAALKKVEEFASSDPEGKAKAAYEAKLAQILDTHKAAQTKSEAELDDARKQLRGHLVTAAATAAIAAKKGKVRALLPHVESQIAVMERNGKFVATVVNPDGQPRLSRVKTDGSEMTIEELVEGLTKEQDFAPLFEGTNSSGSGGVSGGTGGGSGPRVATRDDIESGKVSPDDLASGKVVMQPAA